ncbi:histidine kinase [Actinoplanes sp. NPDC023936]|uniref:sensor histidine kinase n=1 Tax=Actinoplanes sp. NPDC023936 TaxID=3154910 RepID=UPI0033C8FD71
MRGWLADAGAGLLVAGLSALGALTGAGEQHHVPLSADLVTAAIAGLAVALARRAPVAVLVVSAAIEVGYLIAGWAIPPLIFAVGWALYQLAIRYERRVSWSVALGCAVLFWAASVAGNRSAGWWTPLALVCFTLTGMAVAAGEAVRSRRAYVAEVEDRARRAEQSREEEVRRRVAEERVRIARELHDVVAHHIAVINVQSGAASYALTRQPEAAGPPLSHIRRASSIVLRELTSIVGLLRQPGEPDPAHHPQPGLGQLTELLGSFSAAGVRVEHSEHGTSRPLPASADLAAYRIVQEALTNARKHGHPAEPVRVELHWQHDDLIIEVTNATGPDHPPPAAGRAAQDRAGPARDRRGPARAGAGPDPDRGGTGFGLIGMRERAAAAGGMIQVGPADGGRFRVRATLPAPRGYGERL